jgi:superfamily I DNA/RNA helicase
VDARSEINEVVRRIEEAHIAGVPWGQMVVLYGKQSPWQGMLYHALLAKGIPYF